jgi:hypothetical protein
VIPVQRLDQVAAVGLMKVADKLAQLRRIGRVNRCGDLIHKLGANGAVRVAQLDGTRGSSYDCVVVPFGHSDSRTA